MMPVMPLIRNNHAIDREDTCSRFVSRLFMRLHLCFLAVSFMKHHTFLPNANYICIRGIVFVYRTVSIVDCDFRISTQLDSRQV